MVLTGALHYNNRNVMRKEEIIAIAAKVSEGSATKEEMAIYIQHIETFVGENSDWEIIDEAARQAIGAQLKKNIRKHIHKKRHLWPRIAVAAAIASIIFGAWFFNPSVRFIKIGEEISAENDIAPGRQGATLTLANGKKIRLSETASGEIAREGGVSMRRTADGQLIYELSDSVTEVPHEKNMHITNTLSTGKGETYIVTLPDKSKVRLNSASSITYTTYPVQNGERRVNLSGEAYFEIAKDRDHPFVVESNNQDVTVLGTHFNINSYGNKTSTTTTLLEGSIKVTSGSGNALLVPGQQSILSASGNLSVRAVDTELAIAWTNNKFMFDGQTIQEIMKVVALWYDVEIVYEGEVPDDKFVGSVSRFEKISKVLQALEKTENVHFRVSGRKIYVSK